MLKVLFYTKDNCPLCEDAAALLSMLQHDYAFEVEERDIYTNDVWLEEYQLLIPVVKINETTLDCEQINQDTLAQALQDHV